MFTFVTRLGTPCSTRPRARSGAISRRCSAQVAKTDGVGLLRWATPSILSQGSVLIERPM